MKATTVVVTALAMLLPATVLAQDECASSCFSNTTGTSCTASQWDCLCKDQTYVNSTNTCIMTACNSTSDRLGAYYTFAEICAIFGVDLNDPDESSAIAAASTTSLPGTATTGLVSIATTMSSALVGQPGSPSASRPSTAPGIPVKSSSVTVIAPTTSATSTVSGTTGTGSAASTLSTMNPGGPMSSTGSASSTSTSTSVVTAGASSSSASATSTSPGISSGNAGTRIEAMIGGFGTSVLGVVVWALAAL